MFVIQPSLQKVSTVFHRCFVAFSHVNKPFQKRLPSIHFKNHVFYAWKELGSKFGTFLKFILRVLRFNTDILDIEGFVCDFGNSSALAL